jgi:hypothetical protein
MMLFLGPHTWERLFIWLGIGFVIYFLFGYHFSALRHPQKLDSSAGNTPSG